MTAGAARLARIEPRGLRREDAASYVGVSATKFDQLVSDGRMPAPIKVDGCVLWDRRTLDSAFDDLLNPTREIDPWVAHRGAARA